MLQTKRGYKRKYAIGGSGIFDSVANFFKGLISSDAVKSMIDVGKAAGKEAATVAGKKLAEKGVNKLFASPAPPPIVLTHESQAIIDKYKQNTNSIIDGSGRATIQDFARRLNGSGLKST